ncbi:GMC oxidoreductase [Metabacillus arenae]|uniref:GMC family oxidoreductase N-terminal domain-containing protein n=1 Tax=Metabacillus arenae TaxID=2771434 RepID=A0A926NIK8_9BACI|nr:GMC oxidoreductase [Metabacillus arenae]MBD1382016.1 GMC family oxidoreductase N-terminal domain-containing protein [Metabacillus arenae]
MRIYIADINDTLRTIAKKFNFSIETLLSLNPNITNPDHEVAGVQICLPPDSHRSPPFSDIPNCANPFLYPFEYYLDQWIPLTSIEEMASKEYDFIIAGTGFGGGAVLWRLCEKWRNTGKRIAVIEAGDLVLPTNMNNIPTLNGDRNMRFFTNPKRWRTISTVNSISLDESTPLKSSPYYFNEFFGLGGRSLFWGAVTPRMHPIDIAQWPVSLKEMNRYYTISEQMMNVSTEYVKNSTFSEILLNRLLNNGFPETSLLPIAADTQPTQFGNVHSNVFFSSLEFFAWALSLSSFDLAVRARVAKVLTDQGKTVGVEVMSRDKKKYHIKGKNVVLSASTFETPRILLYSGIPGKAIGHYFTTHSRVEGMVNFLTADFPEILGTAGVLIPRTTEREYQIQIGYNAYLYELIPRAMQEDVWFGASGVIESRYENYVSLNPDKVDDYGIPELEIQFSYSLKDKEVIQQMIEGIKSASVAAQGLLRSLCLGDPGLVYHDMGTCRMGIDPATSATNPDGQIHGIQGLYVADNSVIPTSGAANNTLTTVALATRTADKIMKHF